jgi:hypothetical protein
LKRGVETYFDNPSGSQSRKEIACPLACMYARTRFVAKMHGDGLSIVGNDVTP